MQQAVNGVNVPGAFGNAGSRTVVVISSDAYVAGLAGLLHLHWQLPGYQPDFCAPGGALVFELRQSNRSKEYLVRVFYTAQTFDQLRNLTTLTLYEPPATMQLLVPGGSNSATDLDVNFGVFQKLMMNAINPAIRGRSSQRGAARRVDWSHLPIGTRLLRIISILRSTENGARTVSGLDRVGPKAPG